MNLTDQAAKDLLLLAARVTVRTRTEQRHVENLALRLLCSHREAQWIAEAAVMGHCPACLYGTQDCPDCDNHDYCPICDIHWSAA